MYISELSLENFRSFKEKKTINFHEGINVIIGHNNAGKTTVIKALELLFDIKKSKRLSIDDFNKNTTCEELKKEPPKIIISATLLESETEEEYSDDLVTVSTWLTKIESPYEARITYEFYLPEREQDEYKREIDSIKSNDINEYWNEIQHRFLQKYVHKIHIGDPKYKNSVDTESMKKFAFQFLTAIRDVERDLYSGSNALLKEVIDFFMDYEVKINNAIDTDEKNKQIREKKRQFSKDAQGLIHSLQKRMEEGKEHMLRYVKNTGADYDKMQPSFEGSILDTELYSALKLIVENETGIKLPAINNGLGYNNLIYISLLLAKMQKDASGDYLGSNAKIFSILAIEEPEAHLHPNMQYKFLKFLKQNRETEVRQIFITSHSPNITAAVDLEDIIVLYKEQGKIEVAYPGKVFSDSDEDIKSKKYVQRFIDVTKADIFFAKNIVLVEGLAEQLLVPEFSIALGHDLTDTHTSVINIGGRYFEHFLKLFDVSKNSNAIRKKVACITDLDPVRKRKGIKDATWKACGPLFLNSDPGSYEYKACSNPLVKNYVEDSKSLIRVFSQKEKISSTFEYDLILKNITVKELVTESTSNDTEIKKLMDAYKSNKTIPEMLSLLRKGNYKEEVEKVVLQSEFSDDDKKKHIIAGRYLNSINKGEVAQELAYIISSNPNNVLKEVASNKIICPDYIKEAIEWIGQLQQN
ncbi:ATP-dependent nuclease [Cytobacillus firmus]|uniref:RecF/RecN/SMC N domain protein n=1 Tax=Cytobacillus firmus DS1 TaxID=1307436 RepID=W7LBG7_CYTFI|nr:AAA family ATPase [Cytobacillus firmus]EWG09374.1 RecF/RecN/SMC N domain protein [Cytobacillus firmus DS1]